MASHKFMVLLAVYLTIQTAAGVFFKKSISCAAVINNRWTMKGIFSNIGKATSIKIKIQEHDLCQIDLGQCKSQEIPDAEQSCFCTKKEGNRYTVVIMSVIGMGEAGRVISAEGDAWEGPIIIGTIPKISSQVSSKPGAYDLFDDGKEWNLFFRGTAKVKKSMYDVFTKVKPSSDKAGCKLAFSSDTCDGHYLNEEIVNDWGKVKKVAYVLFKGLKKVGFMSFDANGTDYKIFFDKTKLLDNTWKKDLKATATFNIFSTDGILKSDRRAYKTRRFYVSRNHGGCRNDVGWVCELDTTKDKRVCHWEKFPRYGEDWPLLLYSTTDGGLNWTDDKDKVGLADYMALFVSY